MAQVRIRDAGGTLRTITRIRMRDEGGTLRTIQRIRVRDASNILRTVYQSMTVAASPTSISQTGATSTITTGSSTTAVPTGGTAPYTVQWIDSGSYYDLIQATTPTSATTTFRRTGCISGDTYLGEFFCRFTDATGAIADSNLVSVAITRS